MKRGSIDFDFPESKIILDEKGRPVEIKPYERNVATRIIEDFMLMANETVAEDYFWQELPFVYRTHDNPDPEKIKQLGTFINNFGYTIQYQIRMKFIQRNCRSCLQRSREHRRKPLISRLTLRSMKQAKYTHSAVPDILDWQPSITAILHRRSAVIRICRFTVSSRNV